MKHNRVSELAAFVGKKVTLKGWVANFRSSGKILFIQFRDGSGFVQVVVSQTAVAKATWQAAESLTLESSVTITGLVAIDHVVGAIVCLGASALAIIASLFSFSDFLGLR